MLAKFSYLALKLIFFGAITKVICSDEDIQSLELPQDGAATDVRGAFNDFRTTMMYFNEPFIRSSQLHEISLNVNNERTEKLDYGNVLDAAKMIYTTIDKIESGKLIDKAKAFGKWLKDGTEVMNLMNGTVDGAKLAQILLLEKLKNPNDTVVLPVSWKDHAFSMIVSKSFTGFDLTVVNTGIGLKFHHWAADPNNQYYALPRIWIEFKKIPMEEIFPANAWLFIALNALNDSVSVLSIKQVAHGLENYFYGSILSNFQKYFVNADDGSNRLIPANRSESGLVSCLMGSYLYFASDALEYHKTSLIIGNALLENYLKKYRNDKTFKKLISDGFDLTARKLFRITSSSIAKFVLLYLEHKFPTLFKNAALAGLNRKIWISTSMKDAIAELDKSLEDIKIIKQSVELGLEIEKIISESIISKDSRKIKLPSLNSNSNVVVSCDAREWFIGTDQGEIELQSTIDRPFRVLISLNDLTESLSACSNIKNDPRIFACALDVFDQAGSDWWNLIESFSVDEAAISAFLKACQTINLQYAKLNTFPTNLEDLVLFSHLQIAFWKGAVKYDSFFENTFSYLGLSDFRPPSLISSLLAKFSPSITAGSFADWPLRTVFSPKRIQNLKYLIQIYSNFGSGPEFFGPAKLNGKCESKDTILGECEISEIYSILYADYYNFQLYKKMFEHPTISNIIITERHRRYIPSLSFTDIWIKEKFISLTIFYKKFDEVQSIFPQFTMLFNNMMWIYSRITKPAFTLDYFYEHYFTLAINDSYYFSDYANLNKSKLNPGGLPSLNSEKDTMKTCLEFIKTGTKNIFFELRHSQSLSRPDNIINFEAWLNYIKGSKDSKIFDSIYFLYLSNYVLNMPKITNPIEADDSSCYPEGFTLTHAVEVFNELGRLIGKDLNYLLEKRGQISKEVKEKHVNRATDIAVVLVRFIGRIDHDKIASGKRVAKMLADLYKKLLPFGLFTNEAEINEAQISSINLVLAQICNLEIRNVQSFLDSIKSTLPFNPAASKNSRPKAYRITLARYHFFVANMNFTQTKYGESHKADLYARGFIYIPLSKSEVEFSNLLLEKWLVSKFETEPEYINISYGPAGDTVRIQFDKKGRENVIGLNFSNGLLILNGSQLLNIDLITSVQTFNNYFSTDEDKMKALNGEITVFGKVLLFYLKDYKLKGSDIAMVCRKFRGNSYDCEIYRKIGNDQNSNNNWYQWKSDISSIHRSMNFAWTKGYKFFVNKSQSGVLIRDDEAKPLFGILRPDEFRVWTDWESNIFSKWNLKDIGPSSEFSQNYEKHLRRFGDTDLLLATKGTLSVIIYPGLRLKEDVSNPLVLIEEGDENSNQIKNESSFKVFNSSDLRIEADQNAFNSAGIMGTLVASNSENQKFILAPVAQFEQESTDTTFLGKRELKHIEKIPIVDNYPVPQTRLQRLLLAYYCICSREFNLARELLSPSTSINQNEVLSAIEIETIRWILTGPDPDNIKKNINLPYIESPEASALRLMAIMHIWINSKKFPLDYVAGDKDSKNKDDLLKSKRFAALKESRDGFLGLNAKEYFDYLRDLPEKYFVHDIFPEFNNAEIQNYLDGAFNFPKESFPEFSGNFTTVSIVGNAHEPNPLGFSKIIFRELDYVVANLSLNNKNLKEYLALSARLVHRIDKERFSTYSSEEGFIICAFRNPSAFADISRKYNYWLNINENTEDNRELKARYSNEINSSLQRVVKDCFTSFPDDFKYINANSDSRSGNAGSIINILANDVETTKSITIKADQINYKPIKKSDMGTFDETIAAVKALLNPNRNEINTGFSQNNLGMSKVLTKLLGSITEFIIEKGQFDSLELELHSGKSAEIIPTLKKFRFYLESRINDLNNQELTMATSLAEEIGAANPHFSTAHSFESVSRLMHQKKLKSFESLYSCYQKLSVSCIHRKFPQLPMDRCKTILVESMKYYSTHVLIEFLKSLLESTERFIKFAQLRTNVSVDDLMLFLDEAEKIRDFNERLKSPSILNFEYRSKRYRLRSEQVKDIENLTTIDKGTGLFRSAVIQRMMAAGKTLVLGTISVVTKALDSRKLSILVPPSSLYQSNLSAMQARTYGFFKTRGHNFIFPRFALARSNELEDVIIPYLRMIIREIKSIKANNDYYVLSPDSLQSFLNSYVELINYSAVIFKENHVEIPLVSSALSLYAQIYDVFRKQSSIILDEIDMTMDPKKELNFPTVETEPFNMVAAVLITDLMEYSVFSDDVKKIGLDILGNNQSGLTEASYDEYVKILHKYIESQLEDPKSLWSSHLLDIEYPDLNKKMIMEFFTNPDIEFMKDWIVAMIAEEKLQVANSLIILKVQMKSSFREAFKGTANLNFGMAGSLRPDTEYAIPYLAANTPSPSSEFADRWETLLKTLLSLSAANCPISLARNMIGYIRRRIVDESSLDINFKDTVSYKAINRLIPKIDILSLNDLDHEDVKVIHDALNTRSPTAIRLLFAYALDEIFSKMKFPIEQITSNALNMTSMFGSVQGYSGTIDNVNILPREVINGAFQNHMANEKNNGGISLKLIRDSRGDEGVDKTVYQIPDVDLKKPAKDIVNVMINGAFGNGPERDDLSALIDTGAFFKNYKNREVAVGILHNLQRIRVVLYYDEDSNQVEFVKRVEKSNNYEVGYLSSTDPDHIFKATQTDIKYRFTFYDQRHITGSDILQPKTARALMTIGTRVLLRDILQGTLRMRQFMTSQKVHLLTSVAAAKFYFSKSDPKADFSEHSVKVSDMLALGAFNEDEKQLRENEKLAFVKIENEIRRFVLNEITRAITKSPHKTQIIAAWFGSKPNCRNIRDLFIRLIKEKPVGWMNKTVMNEAGAALAKYVDYWIKRMKEINEGLALIDKDFDILGKDGDSGKSFKALQKALQEMIQKPKDKDDKVSLLAFTEDEIAERINEQEGGAQVEMQVFTQQLTEIDVEKLVQEVPPYRTFTQRERFDLDPFVEKLDSDDLSTFNHKNMVSLYEVLNNDGISKMVQAKARGALLTNGKRIGVSKDLVRILNLTPENYNTIFSEYSWEGSHVLFQYLPSIKGIRAVLLSTESAIEMRIQMMAADFNAKGSTFWLCDLSGEIRLTNAKTSKKPKKADKTNILKILEGTKDLLFDLLIFNGSLDQILRSQTLTELMYTKWLKHANFKVRATFLLLRMRVLKSKDLMTFEEWCPELSILRRAARGDKEILSNVKKSSGMYIKSVISEKIESEFFNSNGLPRPQAAKARPEVDYGQIYRIIIGQEPQNETKLKFDSGDGQLVNTSPIEEAANESNEDDILGGVPAINDEGGEITEGTEGTEDSKGAEGEVLINDNAGGSSGGSAVVEEDEDTYDVAKKVDVNEYVADGEDNSDTLVDSGVSVELTPDQVKAHNIINGKENETPNAGLDKNSKDSGLKSKTNGYSSGWTLIIIIVILVVLGCAAGGGYYYYAKHFNKDNKVDEMSPNSDRYVQGGHVITDAYNQPSQFPPEYVQTFSDPQDRQYNN